MKSYVQVDHRKSSESLRFVQSLIPDPLYSGSRLKDHKFRLAGGLRCITVMTYASMDVGSLNAVNGGRTLEWAQLWRLGLLLVTLSAM